MINVATDLLQSVAIIALGLTSIIQSRALRRVQKRRDRIIY